MPMSAPPHASSTRGKEDDAMAPASSQPLHGSAWSTIHPTQTAISPLTSDSQVHLSRRHGNTALDPDRPLNDMQDKGAGPAPVRSVSTPRADKDLARRRRVYRRKMRGGSECRLGRLADRLCADLARDAWQGLQITSETAGLSRRDFLRSDIAAEQS